jgi:hypothetical protein
MATATLFANNRQEVLLRVLRKFAELQTIQAALQAEMNNLLLSEHGAPSNEYAGMDIADALVRFLNERGGEADYMDCERALLDRGCDCGSRPKANIRIAITRNPSKFEWRGVRVARVIAPRMPVQREARVA